MGSTLQNFWKKETEAGEIFIKEMDLPITVEEFRTLLTEMKHDGFLNASLMPGAERLVFHLKEHNIPMALGSGSSIESVKVKFARCKKLFDCFHHVAAGSTDPQVKVGKPAPDIFLVCASRFPENPQPMGCLVFEDALNGVAATLKAGMQIITVPDKKLSRDLAKDATVVLNSLNEFKPEIFGLLPFLI